MISSHCGFQPLKEVWVGGCYPGSFAQALPEKHRSVFQEISEITNQDLQKLQNVLEGLGVVVQRPNFESIELYLDEKHTLIKPPVSPRDWALVLDDTLYIIPQYPNSVTGFDSTVASYKQKGHKVTVLDRSQNDPMCYLSFPSIVRLGTDLVIDINPGTLDIVQPVINKLQEKYKIHLSDTGDHSDAIFCPVAPGHIFSTHYKTSYEQTFPGWEIFYLADTPSRRVQNGSNNQWWLPGYDYAHFNDFVFDVAKDWIGQADETVFEVNMLIVDEKNAIVIAEDDRGCDKLESLGITPHVVNMSTRAFWDGGIHCVTCDIHREGNIINYMERVKNK